MTSHLPAPTDLVVGMDGSEHAARALRWALDEAEVRDVRVRAVLAWSFLGQAGSDLGIGTTEADAQRELRDVVAEAAGERAHLVDAVTVNDLPIDGLLDQARSAALVVVGTRGRGGVRGMLLGSVSRAVIERSPVPVVVVPPPRT